MMRGIANAPFSNVCNNRERASMAPTTPLLRLEAYDICAIMQDVPDHEPPA